MANVANLPTGGKTDATVKGQQLSIVATPTSESLWWQVHM